LLDDVAHGNAEARISLPSTHEPCVGLHFAKDRPAMAGPGLGIGIPVPGSQLGLQQVDADTFDDHRQAPTRPRWPARSGRRVGRASLTEPSLRTEAKIPGQYLPG